MSDDEPSLLRSLASNAFYVEPGASGLAWGARVAVLAGLAVWSLSLFRIAMNGPLLSSSFMHLVHLPFHEGGHILFLPFGGFMTALGGSLVQVLVPLACGVEFLRRRNPFGAAVALWWAGQSLMDVAPYVADARALQLVLLGGGTGAEVEGHDWEAILLALGLINHDVSIGRAVNALGVVLMLAALAWGAWLLLGQHQRRTQSRDAG